MIDKLINPFFGIEDHVALDRNPGLGYNTLLLRLIPGDLFRACPHRQLHTLCSLFDSRATLSNSYPNACMPSREAILYHFHDGLWYDIAGVRTSGLPHEGHTSLPDAVHGLNNVYGYKRNIGNMIKDYQLHDYVKFVVDWENL